jgi:hypothetical protein
MMNLAEFMEGFGKHIEAYRDEHWPSGPDDYESITFTGRMGPDGRVSFSYNFQAKPEAPTPHVQEVGAGDRTRPRV